MCVRCTVRTDAPRHRLIDYVEKEILCLEDFLGLQKDFSHSTEPALFAQRVTFNDNLAVREKTKCSHESTVKHTVLV